MKVFIIAPFTDSPDEPGNNRFRYIAEMLSKKHDVELITTSFSHTEKKQRPREIKKITNYKFKMCFEPGYKKNVSLMRIYSHHVFAKNMMKYLAITSKPDVIYCAVPSLSVARVAEKYAKKHGIRFIVDVQDLWPEAFQMVFRIPVVSNLVFYPLKRKADHIYRGADEVIAVSQTYVDRVLSVNTKCKTGHAIFLGTELETFDKNSKKEVVLKKTTEEIWLAYCGTLGSSYDLKCVIDALDYLKNTKIRFIVMGDGPKREEYEDYADEKGIHAYFFGRLPYDDMCSVLSSCDIVTNPIVGLSVASIINKHADYTACGLPVINTQNSTEYKQLIEDYNMGFSVDPGDYKSFAEKLQILVADSELRKQMGNNARKCAEEKFDRKHSYIEIDDVILNNANQDVGGVTLHSEEKTKMFKSGKEVWLAYCGTLGSSYDLSSAIEAVAKLKSPKLKFVIMGDGPLMGKFFDLASKEKINAVFTGRLAYDEMCSLLKACDIAINPIVKGAAQSIINKHADYAMAGLPVINTQESSEYRNLIQEYGCGINCCVDSVDDVVDALRYLVENDDMRTQMGQMSRKMAEEKFDRKHTYPQIIDIMKKSSEAE